MPFLWRAGIITCFAVYILSSDINKPFPSILKIITCILSDYINDKPQNFYHNHLNFLCEDCETKLQSGNEGRLLYVINRVASVCTIYFLSLSWRTHFLSCVSVEWRNIGIGKGLGKSYMGIIRLCNPTHRNTSITQNQLN